MTKDDHLLRYPVTGCRRYSDVHHELFATPEMEILNEKYREELDQLAQISNINEPLYVHTMWPYIDSIDCHVANNVPGESCHDSHVLFYFYGIVMLLV